MVGSNGKYLNRVALEENLLFCLLNLLPFLKLSLTTTSTLLKLASLVVSYGRWSLTRSSDDIVQQNVHVRPFSHWRPSIKFHRSAQSLTIFTMQTERIPTNSEREGHDRKAGV